MPPPKAAAVAVGKGPTAGTNPDIPMLSGIIGPQLNKYERNLKIQKEVTTTIAIALEEAMQSYSGPTKAEHRRLCRQYITIIGNHLNATVFTETNGAVTAPIHPTSTQKTGSTNPGPASTTDSGSARSTAASRVSWATMAKTGNKTDSTIDLTDKATPHLKPKPPMTPREDTRVLVRVLPERREARGQPFFNRQSLIQKLQIRTADIKDLKPINTGWAIQTADLSTRDKLLEAHNQEIILQVLDGYKVEVPETWVTYCIPGVPRITYEPDTGNPVSITTEMVLQEAGVQTGVQPVAAHITRKSQDNNTDTTTWIVCFKEQVKQFRLFTTSVRAIHKHSQAKVKRHDPGCQGWHSPRFCRLASVCRNCGQKMENHDLIGDGACANPARCANCHGPHAADNPECPCKPAKVDGQLVKLSQAKIKAIRKAGHKQFTLLNFPGGVTAAVLSSAEEREQDAPVTDTAEEREATVEEREATAPGNTPSECDYEANAPEAEADIPETDMPDASDSESEEIADTIEVEEVLETPQRAALLQLQFDSPETPPAKRAKRKRTKKEKQLALLPYSRPKVGLFKTSRSSAILASSKFAKQQNPATAFEQDE